MLDRNENETHLRVNLNNLPRETLQKIANGLLERRERYRASALTDFERQVMAALGLVPEQRRVVVKQTMLRRAIRALLAEGQSMRIFVHPDRYEIEIGIISRPNENVANKPRPML